VFDVMARAPQHVFHVFTKRHVRMLQMAPRLPWPTNVWLGVTVERDDYAQRADALGQVPASVRFVSAEPLLGSLASLDLEGIDWVVAGGESGPRRRPPDPAWLRDLRDRCAAAGVPFYFKGWGGRVQGQLGRELDGREWLARPSGLAVPRGGAADAAPASAAQLDLGL
jgi:protein gp37